MNKIDLTPSYIIFDLEVTHVPTVEGDPPRHIRQLAAYDPSREKTERIFMAYIKVPKAFRKKEEMDFTQYKLKKVAPVFVKWVNAKHSGKPVRFIAHKAIEHDWPIIQQEFLSVGVEMPRFWKPFCTLWLANTLAIPGDRSVTGLCHTLNVPLLPAHDAVNDVKMLKGVFEKMIEGSDRRKILNAMHDEHPYKAVASIIQKNNPVISKLKTSMNTYNTAMKTHNVAMGAIKMQVLDFETDGLFKDGHIPKVVEIGAHIIEDNVSFSTLVNPGCPIPKEAQAVHHISDEDVKNAPDFKTGWMDKKAWQNQFGENYIYIGHNIWGFDEKVRKGEFERTGLPKEYLKCFDTLWLSRHLFKGIKGVSHKLQDLRVRFGIPENEAHRALGDVIVNAQVFNKFTEGVNKDKLIKAMMLPHPILNVGNLIRAEGSFKAAEYASSQNKVVSIASSSIPTTIGNGASAALSYVPNNKATKRKNDELSDLVFTHPKRRKGKEKV